MLSTKKIMVLLLFIITTTASGQQLPQFTQYIYNTMAVNPAYAGSRRTLNVTSLHRNQWAGIEGNPTTNTFSIHSPVTFSRIGLGLSYINDELGGERTNYIYGNVSYTVPLARKVTMSLGLNAGLTSYYLNIPDRNDPFFKEGFSQWNPNFGAGVYVSSNRWYVGLSSPRLLNTDLNEGEYVAIERNSYYIMGGTVYNLGRNNVKLKTTALAKFTTGAPPSYEATASLLPFDKLW